MVINDDEIVMLNLVRGEEKLVMLDSNGKDEEEKEFEWERREEDESTLISGFLKFFAFFFKKKHAF